MINKPERTFRLGNMKASVFVNNGKSGEWRTISLTNRYQDDDNSWKDCKSMSPGDAVKAMYLLKTATDYIMGIESAPDFGGMLDD